MPWPPSSRRRPISCPALLTLAGLLLLHAAASGASPRTLTLAEPAAAGMSATRLQAIEGLLQEAVRERRLPGAVVLVARQGKVVFWRAVGERALIPERRPMNLTTIFDVASLTKVVVTAPLVLQLVEEGRVRLEDPLGRHLSEFRGHPVGRATVRQLLLHTSGLPPGLPREDTSEGPAAILRAIRREGLLAPPGTRYIYSDLNYILLGALLERITGRPLPALAHERIFQRLGMRETFFNPPEAWRYRIAPTEVLNGEVRAGIVHDPLAFRMGGVAGHAGLFSTAEDLARFAQAILNGGVYGGGRILAPRTVALMVSPLALPQARGRRTLGWDVDSPAAVRGIHGSPASFGHTGFTGTALWIDPPTDTFVVFLSNRVHPDGTGDLSGLRGAAISAAGRAVLDGPDPEPGDPAVAVRTGVEVLEQMAFAPVWGRRVGLVTNQTGRDREGRRTADLLREGGVRLQALFSPEHGLTGTAEGPIAAATDAASGLPVHSLYGPTLRPTPPMLRGLDLLLFDLQDVGTRFYTYITTLGYVLEAAALEGLPVVVLDRPNPITGRIVEGPVLDPDLSSFTAYHPLPVRHGMTVGELARLFNDERGTGASLTVIPVRGWKREQWFDETGLPWVNPSPNIRSVTAATLYPAVGLLESANLSVGRGTEVPFEALGAPWIDGEALAAALTALDLPGVRFVPTQFTPRASVYKGEVCQGVRILLTDRETFRAVRTGLEIAATLHRLYPGTFLLEKVQQLLGNRAAMEWLRRGDGRAAAGADGEALEAFLKLRERYLLY
ncbi:MAG: exo-beta-N-acetylmuramidase NamZ domain-containing protein [Candidatus Methylomirabilales bacterium]